MLSPDQAHNKGELTGMHQTRIRPYLLGLFISLVVSQNANAQDNESIVEQFIAAFNQHNVETMLELSAANLRWMSVSGQAIATETSNHGELRESMTAYFASTPSARSEVRSIRASGPFVYTLEQAFWSVDGQQQSQCSVAVYELSDEQIQNVWYFPEHKCEQ